MGDVVKAFTLERKSSRLGTEGSSSRGSVSASDGGVKTYDTNFVDNYREAIGKQKDTGHFIRGNDYLLDELYSVILMMQRILYAQKLCAVDEDPYAIGKDLLLRSRTTAEALAHNATTDVEMGHIDYDDDDSKTLDIRESSAMTRMEAPGSFIGRIPLGNGDRIV